MKKLIFILFAITIIGCNSSHKTSDLLGIWDIVSSTNIESGDVELPDGDNLGFVEFKSDSLYVISPFEEDMVFAWRIEGDSIFLKNFDSFYIKELTKNKLIVENYFISKQQITLKKRK